MKKILVLILPALLLLCFSAAAQATSASRGVADVLRMAAAGVGDDVLLAYVQGAATTFPLTVDQIIELKNAKVGSSVIQAMISHVPAGSAQTSPAPAPAPVAAPTPLANPDPNIMPSPMTEFVPLAPGPGYRWAPGYWTWAGGSWVWISGTWQPSVYIYTRPFYPRPFFVRPFYPHHW